MTFHEIFSAEQLFLMKAKSVLESEEDTVYPERSLADRTLAIIACAFALEAILNLLFRQSNRVKHFDGMSVRAKMEVLGAFGNVDIRFDSSPWKELNELIKTRDWLVHFKEPTIGLLGSCGYITNVDTKIPKLAPYKSLSIDNLSIYYESILCACRLLAQGLGLREHFDYLWTQQYEPWMIG